MCRCHGSFPPAAAPRPRSNRRPEPDGLFSGLRVEDVRAIVCWPKMHVGGAGEDPKKSRSERHAETSERDPVDRGTRVQIADEDASECGRINPIRDDREMLQSGFDGQAARSWSRQEVRREPKALNRHESNDARPYCSRIDHELQKIPVRIAYVDARTRFLASSRAISGTDFDLRAGTFQHRFQRLGRSVPHKHKSPHGGFAAGARSVKDAFCQSVGR